MGRLALAWRILTNGEFAQSISEFVSSRSRLPVSAGGRESSAVPEGVSVSEPVAVRVPKAAAPKPVRSDALTLLATLQREGRLIDFLKEPIDGYSDAQIGAAVRDIHRDCGGVLERQFAIRPLRSEAEGTSIPFDGAPDPVQIKLLGKSPSGATFTGHLVHHGWQSTKCELPQWTGAAETSHILTPAEVELRS
ncbi:MAG: DUF2760 domain-containing protein [Planctomyces sp.]|nr:DUF2760 domain-containing protein [Planctomyces sp.]